MVKGKIINRPVPRVDGHDKVTGKALYAGDLQFPGMLYGKVVHAARVHAEIKGIDISAAKELPGVYAVLTVKDVPGNNDWFGFRFFAAEKVRYQGEAIAVIAAESPEIATRAAGKVHVEYGEDLPVVKNIEAAIRPDAPLVHEDCPGNIIPQTQFNVIKGDIAEGFEAADVVIEREYRTQFVDHAYIEPEACVVVPNADDGGFVVHGSVQNPYSPREGVSIALGLPYNKVRVKQSTLGGSFGGKQEVMVLMCGRAAMLAQNTGRPVKIVNSREDTMVESCKRNPFLMRYRIGATKEGKITALQADLISDGGAYNNQAQFQNFRCSVHATGPYEIPNVEVKVRSVFTNQIYSGAMRGFTSPQTIFAQESLMDELAEKLGIDSLELRSRNFLKFGGVTATGQKLDNHPVALSEVVERVNTKMLETTTKKVEQGKKKGIGLCASFRGCGLGAEGFDGTGAMVSVQYDGSVLIFSGLTDNGQGLRTAHAQIVAEELGISMDRVVYTNTDTAVLPDGGFTVASRGTFAGGQAMRIAAVKLKARILEIAAKEFGVTSDELSAENDKVFVKAKPEKSLSFQEVINLCISQGELLAEIGWHKPEIIHWDTKTGQGNAFPTYTYSSVAVEVEVDEATGEVELKKIVSGHDIGTVINQGLAEGQVHGGVAMGSGFALMENVGSKEGWLKTWNFDNYLIPTSLDIPKAEVILVETEEDIGPFGAKSLGEPATEAVAAAIANAIYDATGKRIRRLPADLEQVALTIAESEES